jgi:hypothetical protein
LQIQNLNIKWFNFEISWKVTFGNLYGIVPNQLSQHSWPWTVKFSKKRYNIFQDWDPDYKNWYDNFRDWDHLCFQSHPCLSHFPSGQRRDLKPRSQDHEFNIMPLCCRPVINVYLWSKWRVFILFLQKIMPMQMYL